MNARFLVEGTLLLNDRRLFVVHGRILDGSVRIGQRVRTPTEFDASVHGVDSLLLSATAGRENVALTFAYRSADELSRWQALGLAGQTLLLADGREEASSDARAS